MKLERKSGETQQDFVYRVLLSFRAAGATRLQLQRASGVPPKSLDGRLSNLEEAGRAFQTPRKLHVPGARRSAALWVADRYATPEDQVERPSRNRATREVARLVEKLDVVWELAKRNGQLAIMAVISCPRNDPRHKQRRCPACHGTVDEELAKATPTARLTPEEPLLPFVPDDTPHEEKTHAGEPDPAVPEDEHAVGGEDGRD